VVSSWNYTGTCIVYPPPSLSLTFCPSFTLHLLQTRASGKIVTLYIEPITGKRFRSWPSVVRHLDPSIPNIVRKKRKRKKKDSTSSSEEDSESSEEESGSSEEESGSSEEESESSEEESESSEEESESSEGESLKEEERHSLMSWKKTRCGDCIGCTSEDCGKCRYCVDKRKNGQKGNIFYFNVFVYVNLSNIFSPPTSPPTRFSGTCIKRTCVNMKIALVKNITSNRRIKKSKRKTKKTRKKKSTTTTTDRKNRSHLRRSATLKKKNYAEESESESMEEQVVGGGASSSSEEEEEEASSSEEEEEEEEASSSEEDDEDIEWQRIKLSRTRRLQLAGIGVSNMHNKEVTLYGRRNIHNS
jgi:hypothetical protein